MGTTRHSRASKKRWKGVSKEDKFNRMSSVSKAGWDNLTPRQRRKRALNSARSRRENLAKIKAQQEQHE